jgi:hypothetical protein
MRQAQSESIAERFDPGKAGLAAGAPAPGIVDEDVDVAELRQGGIDHALHGGVLAHIGHGMSHLNAKFGADFCGDPGTGFGIDIGQPQAGAFSRKAACHAFANAGTCARDQGHAVLQSVHCSVSSFHGRVTVRRYQRCDIVESDEKSAHECGGRTTHGWPGFAHAD